MCELHSGRMGCHRLRFVFLAAPPLVDVVRALRERTELELSADYHEDGHGVVVTEVSRESVDLYRRDSSIDVEFFPSEWRGYYLVEAALALLVDLGGVPEHPWRARRWARRPWRQAPKAYFIARWAGNLTLVALWLPFHVLFVIGVLLAAWLTTKVGGR